MSEFQKQSISNKTIERVGWKNPIAPTTHFETLTLTKTLHPKPQTPNLMYITNTEVTRIAWKSNHDKAIQDALFS